jgi:hypothetical protein
MDLSLLLDMAADFDDTRLAVTDVDGISLATGRLRLLSAATASLFRISGGSHVGFCGVNSRAVPVALFGALCPNLFIEGGPTTASAAGVKTSHQPKWRTSCSATRPSGKYSAGNRRS